MIHLKSEEEIELIKESSLLVGKTLAEVAGYIKPGVQTAYLDKIAEDFIRGNGAIPGFKHYRGYPASLCISVNDQVVHGIPGKNEIKDGDVVSIDCGVVLNGYNGDSAYTFAVGDVSPETMALLKRTKESLYKGIEKASAGCRLGDIGYAVQSYVEQYGYSVVRELVGHGIGKHLHEEPQVPNYGRRGSGHKLKEGTVICIEPMVNLGLKEIIQERDGWTIRTRDGKPSAHFEHAVAVRKNQCEVLSTFEYIDKVKNENLKTIN
ncbi:MAG TPA: type I methionyl aminopeptidase [Bacteroidales bacterium]|nr:type I methionyl aminopeptidase [Bacteroidales bacterium]HPB26003.1 type I methionyl aminopeptidase [Bacteroidales bacterium]HPI30101.1 type I methionyl aminopeptidase [Bacteroidales bacterium]HQN16350.1 type I methionyl aminopeptidase [Bacteroidales bacterium]HQP15954.1 type I methionyl aminopeptidase [Bacteroidales bacterium]